MRNRVLSVVLALALVAFVPTLSAFADEGAVGLTDGTVEAGSLTTLDDTTPPVLSGGKFEWVYDAGVQRDVATFTFTTSEDGWLFIDSVDFGAPAPDLSYIPTITNPTDPVSAGVTTFQNYMELPGSPEKDYYVSVRDAAGNVSQPLVISTYTSVLVDDDFWISDSPFTVNTWYLYADLFDLVGADTVSISISYPYASLSGSLVEYWTLFWDYANSDDVDHAVSETNGGLTATITGLAVTGYDSFTAGLSWSKSFAGQATITVAVDGVTRYTTTITGTLAPPSPPTDYTVVTEFPAYEGKGDVSAQIDAPFAEFVQLTLDGKVVDPVNYTITEDTFTITLAKAYLDTLARGEYVFVVEFSGGTAQLPLSIQTMSDEDTPPAQEADTLPKTGDSMVPLATVLLLLAGGTTLLLRSRRRAT